MRLNVLASPPPNSYGKALPKVTVLENEDFGM
jgi:hypothetical protein